METANNNSLFATCLKGHDLTVPDAFIYTQAGFRSCRQCTEIKKPRKNIWEPR